MAEPRGRVIPLASAKLASAAPGAAEIIAASPTALLIVDPAGNVVQTNAAAEMLLNLSDHHLVGKPLRELLILPASYDPGHEGAFAAYDFVMATHRGHRFRADFLVSPFVERPGWRLVSLQAGASSHRMGHRFERSSGPKAAVKAAAMLAHEIKNPLAGIRGAAQLLSGDGKNDRLTRLIRDEVDRVAALIDRMEGFTDTRPIQCLPENIHAIADHARAVAMSGFGASLEISDSYDPSLPEVLVHRDSMVQIILNLLKNAAESAEDGGKRKVRITTAFRHGVSVTEADGQAKKSLPIELCVIDDGPGAPAEIADQLFDPFVSSKAKGQGLGLALVDKLVRDMGGIVQYAREGSPERTVFRILLPRAEGRAR